jgi:multidrug efflux pump subunit AcrB
MPVLLLTEPAKSLFAPLGLAVCGSMMSSYFLSRTVVPVMAKYMLAGHVDVHHKASNNPFAGMFKSVVKKVDSGFERLRLFYKDCLIIILARRILVVTLVVCFMAISLSFIPYLGADFFPTINGDVLRMHVAAPRGTRVEETERIIKRVERDIPSLIGSSEIDDIADIMGVPNSGLNLSSSDSVNYTEADGEILVTLTKEHKQSGLLKNILRDRLPKMYPDCIFFFQPADIVTQILNAGLAAPIDIQVRGMDTNTTYAIAEKIENAIKTIPGAVDVHVKQSVNGPVIDVNVNREKASQLGFTQRDVANSMLVSLSSSFQTAPNFWVNPKNGVNYSLAVQTPQRLVSTMSDLSNTIVTSGDGRKSQLLGNLALFTRDITPTIINHYNVQPVFDVLSNVEGTDLNAVAQKVQLIVDSYHGKLPHGVFIDVRGQITSMLAAYRGLLTGIALALVLVYLLLVVNFQSWTDPLIILMAIPGALCGIVWSLFLTQTPISVPALMGAIMSIGVASANSILVVSFAREQLHEGKDALESALNAGATRFRPVLMTAAAMLIGMIPMAIGSGSGGSQNAPLGRAVIGGLVVATFFTLIWVPLVFSLVHRNAIKHENAEKPLHEIGPL